jgi:hypothetical protein
VALTVERGVICAYLCDSQDGRTFLARVELQAVAKTTHALRISELPVDLGTAIQLTVSTDSEGDTRVHLGGTRALYRVVLSRAPAKRGSER